MGLQTNQTQPLVKLMKAVYPTHVLPINQNTPTMDALIFSIVASSVSLFGLVLCSIVLVVLRTGYNAKQNLIITILVTICFVENFCFIFLWGNYYMFEDQNTRRQINRLLFIVCTGIYQMFVFSLVAMTTDRFIAFFKPFKYKKLVTRERIFKYYCITILITIAVRAPFFIGWSSIPLGALFKIDIINETLLLLPQPFIYALMYRKWKNRIVSYKHLDRNTKKRRKAEHRMFIFLSIILFVTCLAQAFSDAFHVVGELTEQNYRIMGYLSNGLWIFVIFITPVCHVFAKPSVRHKFNSSMRKSWRSIRNNSVRSSSTVYEMKVKDSNSNTLTKISLKQPVKQNSEIEVKGYNDIAVV